jgi:ABC-type nitrate/sulfonate/bicarbonate transport system substrate-binding protein
MRSAHGMAYPPRLLIVAVAFASLVTACATGAAPPPKPAAPAAAPASGAAPASNAPAAAPAPPQPASMEYAMITPVVNYWQIFVARDKGFFDQQSLQVEISMTETTSRAVQGLVSGSYDVGGVTADSAIHANEKGNGDLAMVAGELNRAAYNLVTSKDVRSFADLRGKTLGVSDLNDGSTVLLRRMLASNGLQPSDYDIVPIGGTGNRAAGISNGSVAGALIGQPQDFRMLDDGFPSLGYSSDYVAEYQFEVIATRREWARQNEERLVRFLRAIVQANAWLYDRANKDEAAQLLADATRAPLSAATRTYDVVVERYEAIPKAGEVNRQGLQNVISIMGELDLLPQPLPSPDKFLDLSYLEKARAASASR